MGNRQDKRADSQAIDFWVDTPDLIAAAERLFDVSSDRDSVGVPETEARAARDARLAEASARRVFSLVGRPAGSATVDPNYERKAA